MPASERLVCLQKGFVVPVEVFDLVLECERRGITLTVRNGSTLDVESVATLPSEVVELLKAWKPHILAVLAYTPSDRHLFDNSIPAPRMGPIQQVSK